MAMQPIITGIDVPALQGQKLHLTGTGFGRVSSVGLVDVTGNEWDVEHIVDTGYSITAYIPFLLPAGVYYPLLKTLDNLLSINQAGNITIPVDPNPLIPPSAVYPEPIPNSASVATVEIRNRARMEIGDRNTPFQTSAQADGYSTIYSMPKGALQSVTVTQMLKDGTRTILVGGTDYNVDFTNATVNFTIPSPDDATLTFSGQQYSFFSDADLDLFVRSAALKHTHSAEALARYIDAYGFRKYFYTDATVDTIPPVEHSVLALLVAIEALEVIKSDLAFDIDISTAEGTSIPRTQRFRNVDSLIASKQMRYDDLCAKLGVGLGRIEVFTFRRVSRTTGKLVPVWIPREYDERGLGVNTPLRVLTPRNKQVTGSGFVQPDPRAYYSNGGGF
jgi:hypothetical protein